MQFDGPTRGELRLAIEDAFTPGNLPMMLAERLNRKWFKYVPPAASFPEQVFALLDRANAENWIEQIAVRALEFNPGNPQLAAFAAKIKLTAWNDHFEKTIHNQNQFLDLNIVRTKMRRIEFQVCRIEVPTEQGYIEYGTGFLVGADCLLTNYHVVEAAIAGENGATTPEGHSAKPDKVRCRFDYKELEGQVVNPGTVYKLAPNWCIDRSEPDPAGPQKLDYALLRLENRVAGQPIAAAPGSAGETRGFIRVPANQYPFPAGTPLFIVQHPAAGPLKIAFETTSIVSVAGDRSRVEHKTNTEHGSSGSPCFTQNLDPVGLHQGSNDAGNNICMPLDAIRALMAQHGADQSLG